MMNTRGTVNKQLVTGAVAMLGLAFWWPFLRTSITGALLAGRAAYGFELIDVYTYALAALAVAAAALSATTRARGGATARRAWARPALCCLGFGASVLDGCLLLVPDPAETLSVAVAFGLSGTLFFLSTLWPATLSALSGGDSRRLLLLLIGSYVLSFVVGAFSYLPAPLSFVRPVGAPVIACVAWAYADHRAASRTPNVDASRPRRAAGWRPYAATLLLVLVAGVFLDIVKSGTAAYLPSDGTFVRDSINVLIGLVALAMAWRSADARAAYLRVFMLLCFSLMAGVLLSSLANSPAALVGRSVVATGAAMAKVLLFFEVIRTAAFRHNPQGRIACLFVLPQALDLFAAYKLVPFIFGLTDYSYTSFWGTASLVAGFSVCIVLLALLCVVTMRDMALPPAAIGGARPAGAGGVSRALSSREASAILAKRYTLSEREQDVVTLILDGNTLRNIPGLLGLSEGTVQTHTKNIYRKLGIHSKQELIDMANAERG